MAAHGAPGRRTPYDYALPHPAGQLSSKPLLRTRRTLLHEAMLEDLENGRTPLAPNSGSKSGFLSFLTRSTMATKEIKQQPFGGQMSPDASMQEEVPIRLSIDAKDFTGVLAKELGSLGTGIMPTPPRSMASMNSSRRASRMTMKSTTFRKDSKPLPPLPKFEPPPLFQAYPQAIKHGSVQVPTMSIEEILRVHQYQRYTRLRQGLVQGAADCKGDASNPAREGKVTLQHGGSISKTGWSQKIYVLVTSGYLLQYAGNGAFDRLPEKILQLGRASAAFASDAIPGKHWVLQVSQLPKGAEPEPEETKSKFAKFSFRNSVGRRAAANFLLVLDGAEEMNSWMREVRKEIDAMGGKRYQQGIQAAKKNEEESKSESPPNRSTFIIRNPSPFSGLQPNQPSISEVGEDCEGRDATSSIRADSASVRTNPTADGASIHTNRYSSIRHSMETQPSIDTRITATTEHSHEQAQLENLRGDARLSKFSSWTPNTSPGTSPALTPKRGSFGLPQIIPSTNGLSSLFVDRRSTSTAVSEADDYNWLLEQTSLLPKPLRTRSSPTMPAKGDSNSISSRSGKTRKRSGSRASKKAEKIPPLPTPPISATLSPSTPDDHGNRQRVSYTPSNDSPTLSCPPSIIDRPEESPVDFTAGPLPDYPLDWLTPSSPTPPIPHKSPRRYNSLKSITRRHPADTPPTTPPSAGSDSAIPPVPTAPATSIHPKSLCRPVSMQPAMRSPQQGSVVFPTIDYPKQRAASDSTSKAKSSRVLNRKSMPALLGPPPAPPPSCPLPEVPQMPPVRAHSTATAKEKPSADTIAKTEAAPSGKRKILERRSMGFLRRL
ncbi:MAG: hypothetical protein M1833_000515 [Piccolia ochrophora]|nr:MAG: hypothetical protein M1833_000515 [Piccolia ochrophora]